jgi:hypothetical protein
LGRSCPPGPSRDDFISELTARDPWKAAIFIRPAFLSFGPPIREKIIDFLGGQLSNGYACRQAKAAELLGLLKCLEAADTLATHAPSASICGEMLCSSIALAATRLGATACVEHVFKCRWFRRALFFADVRAYLESSDDHFQQCLREFALQRMQNSLDADERVRGTHILAYLRDPRLLDLIETKLHQPPTLRWYEIQSLLNFSCARSAALFGQVFLIAAAEHRARDGRAGGALDDYMTGVMGLELAGTLRQLSVDIEQLLVGFLQSEDDHVRSLARELSRCFPSLNLVRAVLDHCSSEHISFSSFGRSVGHILDFESWHGLWTKYERLQAKRWLIEMTSRIPDPRVDSILLACLKDRSLNEHAMRALAERGCLRAAPVIRLMLENIPDSPNRDEDCLAGAGAQALGVIRDPLSPGILLVLSHKEKTLTAVYAVQSLAQIRTEESGNALLGLSRRQVVGGGQTDLHVDSLAGSLLRHGATQCVENVVERARTMPSPCRWLMEQLSRSTMLDGWSRWRFKTHVDLAPIITLIRSQFGTLSPTDQKEILEDFRDHDSHMLREFLREVLAGSFNQGMPPSDAVHGAAAKLLAERGDSSAVHLTVARILSETHFFQRYSDELQNFDRKEVTTSCLSKLASPCSAEEKFRLLYLIGELGTSSAAAQVSQFQSEADIRVADAACVATTRLTDPRLLPDGWE